MQPPRDYNKDPTIKALTGRGFINHGSTLGKKKAINIHISESEGADFEGWRETHIPLLPVQILNPTPKPLMPNPIRSDLNPLTTCKKTAVRPRSNPLL